MSEWRRRAVEVFPEFQRDIADPLEVWDVMSLWMFLLQRTFRAHRDGDENLLGRIYDYALWCHRSSSSVVSDAVALAFYEHLLDREETLFGRDYPRLGDVLTRLHDDIVRDVWPLWARRLPLTKMDTVRALLRNAHRPAPKPRPPRRFANPS